ncbi:type VI secretion system membrane subunit TssM [Endozoicomonas sp. OPT23]|uniref:type VI secretion system membrane subunit TssM n=1 Tax=Endozoicomonas sp. OPT23 TaxID=2072845 RepID=UPI00129A334E|nr:type VI secretion system membrane subunit TssM [Endozoicomonas sp. OPT23]MRI33752.1 type VI secretion system membrane subunit TssM [Endozoicomonas sp. OPT23]
MKKLILIVLPLLVLAALLAILFFPSAGRQLYGFLIGIQQKWLMLALMAGLVLVLFKPLMGRLKTSGKQENKGSGKEEGVKETRQAIAQLNQNWRELWKKLKELHGANPYHLPWLMILGTEGAGKTSWLIDSGFEKIAGTRSDLSGVMFWLGESSVIIELAGDYYHKERSQMEEQIWLQLMKLLKRKRPRQPLTGLLASLSLDQLVVKHPTSLLELARQMRWRLYQLDQSFAMQLPVWLLLTQSDRLSGFTDFFRTLSHQEQSEPLGFCLLDGYSRSSFSDAFRDFHQSLFSLIFTASYQEKNVNSRLVQMRYVLQFCLLGERLTFFCDEVFVARQNQVHLDFKGVWFNSCGQQGNASNLLASEIALKHGFMVKSEQVQVAENHSYFNRHFLPRVVFDELGRVGESVSARKIRLTLMSLSSILLAGFFLAGVSIFAWHIKYNSQLLDQLKQVIPEYQYTMSGLKKQPAVAQVIEPLLSFKKLNEEYHDTSHWFYHMGLFDSAMSRKVNRAYQQQLQQWLLKPIARTLAGRLKNSEAVQSVSLVDDLQFYLMLFQAELLEPELLQKHILAMAVDMELSLSSQQGLELLLEDLWSLPFTSIYPDKGLIDKARVSLSRQSEEQLVMDQIQVQDDFSGTLSYDLLLGESVLNAFQVADASKGFPALYTRATYEQMDLGPTSGLVRREVIDLNLIRKGYPEVSSKELELVSRKVRKVYFQNYIRQWQALIGRINLKKINRPDDLVKTIASLFQGERAALHSLLATIEYETRLAPETDKKDSKKNASSPSGKVVVNRQQSSHPITVNQAFDELGILSPEKQTAVNQALAAVLSDLQLAINQSDNGLGFFTQANKIMGHQKNSLDDLFYLASTEEGPLKFWLEQLANQVMATYIKGATDYVQYQWSQRIYPYWRQYLDRHFPIEPTARKDVRPEDFVDFFKPDGILDRFINTILANFLNFDGWIPNSVNGHHLPLSSGFLKQLEYVQKMRAALFSPDGQMKVTFRIQCVELSPAASELSIRDSLGKFIYQHGPHLWQDRHWPGSSTENMLVTLNRDRLVLAQQSFLGPWAWFHFVFASQQWRNDDRLVIQYKLKGYQVKLEATLDRRINPFNPVLYNRVQLSEHIF